MNTQKTTVKNIADGAVPGPDTDRQASRVLAAVVTYNPEMKLLHENLAALCPQTDLVVVYDNASENITEIRNCVHMLRKNFPGLHLIRNRKNLGTPANYNRAAALAEREHIPWLLLMDQDSVIPPDMIPTFLRYADREKTAIICPAIWDVNAYKRREIQKNLAEDCGESPYTLVTRCLSSGSMYRVDILRRLGGFDEKYFLDMADFDFCRRAVMAGYKILRVNSTMLRHQIGHSGKAKFAGRDFIVLNYSPIRYYYIFRNRVYFARKHKLTPLREKEFYLVFPKMLIMSFYEKETLKKILEALRGTAAGLRM